LPRAEAEVFRSPRGEGWIWHPARGVLVTQVVGVMTVGIAAAICATSRRILATGAREIALHDWERVTDYEPQSRVLLTDIAREAADQIEMNHILLGSRIVALAVQAASLVVSNIKVHTQRTTLEGAIASAVRTRRLVGT
jgi:hypothetical protein